MPNIKSNFYWLREKLLKNDSHQSPLTSHIKASELLTNQIPKRLELNTETI